MYCGKKKKKKKKSNFISLYYINGFYFLSHLRHITRVTPPNFIGENFVP
jgi:hypothetical protein